MHDLATLLAHSKDLDLVVRHVLAGLGHGLHAGRERGAGVEFSEYRAYAPGDEWRRVDWKLLARNDRYYVREAERDSHVAVWFWLDASASMAEQSYRPEAQGFSKLDYARVILACLAAVAQRQGDAFGLIVASDGGLQLTPASRGPRQFQRVLARAQQAKPSGSLADAETISAHLHFARAPSLIFWLTDALDWPSAQSESLIRLRRMQHDVRVLCLRTEAERDAQFANDKNYVDPERDQRWVAWREGDRASYLHNAKQHFAKIASDCRQANIPYWQACIEENPATCLRSFLRQAGVR